MRNYATWRCLLTVVCVLLVPVVNRSAAGQNPTFNIEGVVTDAQQAVLPGVAVTITNTATGLTRTVTTADNGRYVVRALPPEDRKSTRLNSSHGYISYAVFCLKKKKKKKKI